MKDSVEDEEGGETEDHVDPAFVDLNIDEDAAARVQIHCPLGLTVKSLTLTVVGSPPTGLQSTPSVPVGIVSGIRGKLITGPSR